jgi:hypothetical protein
VTCIGFIDCPSFGANDFACVISIWILVLVLVPMILHASFQSGFLTQFGFAYGFIDCPSFDANDLACVISIWIPHSIWLFLCY